nr:class I SAM-dependent methyltransferase [Mycobacterium uberis]
MLNLPAEIAEVEAADAEMTWRYDRLHGRVDGVFDQFFLDTAHSSVRSAVILAAGLDSRD